MRKFGILSFAFGAGAAGAFLLLAPSIGEAASFLTLHASACVLETGVNETTQEGKQGFLSTSGGYSVICPFIERQDFKRNQVSAVTIYGARADNPFVVGDNTRVKVCRSFSATDSGVCGAETSSPVTGNVVLTVQDLSIWSNTTGFPYVYAASIGRNPDFRGVGYDG